MVSTHIIPPELIALDYLHMIFKGRPCQVDQYMYVCFYEHEQSEDMIQFEIVFSASRLFPKYREDYLDFFPLHQKS